MKKIILCLATFGMLSVSGDTSSPPSTQNSSSSTVPPLGGKSRGGCSSQTITCENGVSTLYGRSPPVTRTIKVSTGHYIMTTNAQGPAIPSPGPYPSTCSCAPNKKNIEKAANKFCQNHGGLASISTDALNCY